jgi:hypothetical protein
MAIVLLLGRCGPHVRSGSIAGYQFSVGADHVGVQEYTAGANALVCSYR